MRTSLGQCCASDPGQNQAMRVFCSPRSLPWPCIRWKRTKAWKSEVIFLWGFARPVLTCKRGDGGARGAMVDIQHKVVLVCLKCGWPCYLVGWGEADLLPHSDHIGAPWNAQMKGDWNISNQGMASLYIVCMFGTAWGGLATLMHLQDNTQVDAPRMMLPKRTVGPGKWFWYPRIGYACHTTWSNMH